MNILVIGNGFDLAHKLPTKYTDFLVFCKTYLKCYKKEIINNKLDWKVDSNIKKYIRELFDKRLKKGNAEEDALKADERETAKNRIQDLYDLIKNNTWIDYFQQNPMYQKENWIDFENEISKVIQSLDNGKELEAEIGYLDNKFFYKRFRYKGIRYKDLKDILLIDLKKLVRALEIYLCDYVEKIQIQNKSPDIVSLKIDHVISFNYTNTFSRLYNDKGEIDADQLDYIHGKAKINNTIESNKMVLGTDEYLPYSRKGKDLDFIAFKKFYQRAYKDMECKYIKWVDEIKSNPKEDHNLYIFGHSLDITDGDVLRYLIINNNVFTTVFYLNNNTKGRQMENLIKVIGQDEFIKRATGNTKTIEFKKQQDMQLIIELFLSRRYSK